MKRERGNNSSFGASLALLAFCATFSIRAAAAWSTEVYTTVVNGVEWMYKIDAGAKTAYLVKRDGGAIVEKTMAGVLHIPAALFHEGVSYSVTTFDTLSACSKLTGVVFPETTHAQEAADSVYTFQNMTGMVALWFKGPETVASGTQPVASIANAMTQCFRADSATRVVLLGPNVYREGGNGEGYPMFRYSKGYTRLFIPAARWPEDGSSYHHYFPKDSDGNPLQGKAIRYGPGRDIDISIDGVFTVANTNRLDDVLEVANDLHDYCGMKPRIIVTNVTEIAEGLITADRLKNAACDSLIFVIKNQAQLDAILAAVPDGMPVGIDCSGATENLQLPSDIGDSVWLKLPESREHFVDSDKHRIDLLKK